jgi:2-succinyl-6-hydroxy-2,4-cyclohexadiene-1-carboxylate synthase
MRSARDEGFPLILPVLPSRIAGSPHNPCLFMLHGFMGCKEDFEFLLPRLSRHFYCVAIDLPYHGEAVAIHWGWSEMAEYLVATQARFSPNRPSYLYGYSLGGRIALYTALNFPQSWAGVVLESASAGLVDPIEQEERQQRDGSIARKLRQKNLDFEEFLRSWYQQQIFQGLNDSVGFEEMLKRRQLGNPQALADALETFSLGRQPFLGNLLAQSSLPLLLLAGELDPKFVQIQKQMAVLCPTAQVEILAECSHNLQFQQPDLLSAIVYEWLLG